MKVVFAGTPEFAVVALKAIHAAGHEIVLVLTQPDRPAGRGMHLHISAVKQFALQHQLALIQPASLRLDGKFAQEAAAVHTLLKTISFDVMVVAAYGLILPQSVLTIPKSGCLNIHASLLPRWRGAAPIHRALEAGDAQTGITIMQMDSGLDTGAVLSGQSLCIAVEDNQATLHDKLALLGGQMIVDALQKLPLGNLKPVQQSQQGITYAAKVSKQEANLDFTQPAIVLERKIRAFNPFPASCAVLHGVTLKIWHAELALSIPSLKAGQIKLHEQTLLVACGTGALRLLTLQKPGGTQLPTAEFLKGFLLNDGDCFSWK